MLLTNFLPNGGNGTYTLYAHATDKEGREVQLGAKTITCNNAAAVKPFGAIDTPEQGGQISGSGYFNFGWALTPMPNSIPTDGSTIGVWVDGALIGQPTYNNYRNDIATLFPGYANSLGAVGVYTLDTTGYANGLHTIAWSVRDGAGNEDGIGSRYFSIMNTGTPTPQGLAPVAEEGLDARGSNAAGLAGDYTRHLSFVDELRSFRDASFMPLYARKGFDRSLPPDRLLPTPVSPSLSAGSRSGLSTQAGIPSIGEGHILQIRELERLEILLDDKAWSEDVNRRTAERAGLAPIDGGSSIFPPSSRGSVRDLSASAAASSRWEGYLIVGDELRALPIGSTLDSDAGVFSWQLGPGFLGDYRLAFVDRTLKSMRRLTIRIEPRYSKAPN
jgi:hypothetical protein